MGARLKEKGEIEYHRERKREKGVRKGGIESISQGGIMRETREREKGIGCVWDTE